MTMKKLLERIDSIERKQTTTLTEGVGQGVAGRPLKEFFGDENDFSRGSGRRRPDISIKYLLGQDFLVIIDGEKYSLSILNLGADLKDKYKHLYDRLYDSKMQVKPEYLDPKYWDLQIAHTEFFDVEGNRPDEDTVEQVIEMIETQHPSDLEKVYTFHQKKNSDYYEVTYQKPSPMKISDFVNKNQDSGASAVPGLDKQQLGTAINQYFDKILSYDDSGLTVLDRIAKVWDSLFTKHNGNIDSIIDNEPANVLMKVIQEFKQVLAALGRGLKESRSTTKKSKNQRQGMKEGDWGWDDPQYDRQPPERPDDMDAFKQDRQRRADDAKLDTKKSKNQRQGVAEATVPIDVSATEDLTDRFFQVVSRIGDVNFLSDMFPAQPAQGSGAQPTGTQGGKLYFRNPSGSITFRIPFMSNAGLEDISRHFKEIVWPNRQKGWYISQPVLSNRGKRKKWIKKTNTDMYGRPLKTQSDEQVELDVKSFDFSMYKPASSQGVAEGKTVKESKAKPDYIDLDGDGDRKESMKKAAADKKHHKKPVQEARPPMEEPPPRRGHRPPVGPGGDPEKSKGSRPDPYSKAAKKPIKEPIKESWTDFDDAKRAHEKAGSTVTGRPEDYTVTMADGTRKRFITKDGRRKLETLPPVKSRQDDEDDASTKKTAKSADKKAAPPKEGEKKRGRPAGSKNKRKVSEMTDFEFSALMGKFMLIEAEMTATQKNKKKEMVTSMEKDPKALAGFKERYGKRWKSVMNATATARAMGKKPKTGKN